MSRKNVIGIGCGGSTKLVIIVNKFDGVYRMINAVTANHDALVTFEFTSDAEANIILLFLSFTVMMM